VPLSLDYAAFRYDFSVTKVKALDGYEEWPTSKLRSGGFDQGFINLPTGAPTTPFSFPLVFWATGYDIFGPPVLRGYLSGKTPSTSQLFALIQDPGTLGGFEISISAAGIAAFGDIVGPFGQDPIDTQEKLDIVCKNLHFYCQRPSDQAIQWVDIWSAVQVGV
jgi:hypothetical protein